MQSLHTDRPKPPCGAKAEEVLNKAERRTWILEPDAAIRLAIYVLGLSLVVRAGGG